MARHRQCLPAAITAQLPAGDDAAESPVSVPGERSDRTVMRTGQRHADIRRLPADGRTTRAIAAELGLARSRANPDCSHGYLAPPSFLIALRRIARWPTHITWHAHRERNGHDCSETPYVTSMDVNLPCRQILNQPQKQVIAGILFYIKKHLIAAFSAFRIVNHPMPVFTCEHVFLGRQTTFEGVR